MSTKKPRKIHTQEFKAEALKLSNRYQYTRGVNACPCPSVFTRVR